MSKRTVLDVGNCVPDHASIKGMLCSHFDVDVLQTHGPADTLKLLSERMVDLVLINRKLDQDYSNGTEILRMIKADEKLSKLPVMVVTNLPDHQEAAIQMGAERGFGKLELRDPVTHSRLAAFLGSPN